MIGHLKNINIMTFKRANGTCLSLPIPLPISLLCRFCHLLAGSADSISQSKSEGVLIRLQDVVADSSADGRPFLSLCSLIDHQLTGIITKEVCVYEAWHGMFLHCEMYLYMFLHCEMESYCMLRSALLLCCSCQQPSFTSYCVTM